MIFLGDGDTDIPCMRLVASQGGCAVAVLDPYRWSDPLGVARIHTLIAEDRVSFVAPADYLPGSQLDVIVKGARIPTSRTGRRSRSAFRWRSSS